MCIEPKKSAVYAAFSKLIFWGLSPKIFFENINIL